MRRLRNFKISSEVLEKYDFNRIISEIKCNNSPTKYMYIRYSERDFQTSGINLSFESMAFDPVKDGEVIPCVLIDSIDTEREIIKSESLDSSTFKCICDPQLIINSGCKCGGK